MLSCPKCNFTKDTIYYFFLNFRNYTEIEAYSVFTLQLHSARVCFLRGKGERGESWRRQRERGGQVRIRITFKR